MTSCKGKYILLFIVLISCFDMKAQEQRKVSLNGILGLAFLPKSEKVAPSGLPKNIFGGYAWSGVAGIGMNYRLGEKVSLFENFTFLHAKKKNYSFSTGTFKTGLKYNILSRDKKISPFVFGSIDFSLFFVNRKENSRDYYPDSLANSIGSGFGATKITYNEEKLNLSFVPVLGGSAGAGVDVKLSHKISLFLTYGFNTSFAAKSGPIKKNYFYNKSDLSYSMVSAGLTLHLFRKSKQLLASLGKEAWEEDKTISVRGTIIYNKNKKSNNKIIPVELTDKKDSTLKILPSSKEGEFFVKDLAMDDFKFMLEKRNKRIKKAELEVIHDHRKIKVAEEFVMIEMMDDLESENIISRDGNFSVVLREGFQHEIDVSVTGQSITGQFNNVEPDTSCHDIEVLLYDKQDSLIKGVPASQNCSFEISDVVPGQYKVVIRNKDKITFDYQFTEAAPLVTRQVNAKAPKISYFIAGNVHLNDNMKANNINLKLMDMYGKVMEEASLSQSGEFLFEDLETKDYQVIYELTDKETRGSMNYSVKAINSVFNKDYSYNFGKPPVDTLSRIVANGKITRPFPKSSEGVEVFLVDPSNQVVQKTRTDEKGSFHFSKLPSKDYKVAYALADSTLKANLKYDIVDEGAPSEEVFVASAKAVRNVSVQKKVKLIESSKTDGKKEPVLVKENNNTNYRSFTSHKTYSIDGVPIQLEGFGVQVASYKLVDNLKHSIAKLRENGYNDIYIQVINMSIKGKNEKLYRVIIGVHEDLNELREREESLKTLGYQTVCRKHI
jgi:hypothetical protein